LFKELIRVARERSGAKDHETIEPIAEQVMAAGS